jgi:hypothetical protein
VSSVLTYHIFKLPFGVRSVKVTIITPAFVFYKLKYLQMNEQAFKDCCSISPGFTRNVLTYKVCFNMYFIRVCS